MRAFLSDCQRVENLAASIYRRFSRDPGYSPWVCEVFRKLALEEREHAGAIDMVSQASEDVLDALPKLAGDTVDAAVRMAHEISDSIDVRRPTEEEALRLAIRMEREFVKVHVQHAVHSYNEQIAALFRTLRRGDMDHADRLQRCLDRWRSESGRAGQARRIRGDGGRGSDQCRVAGADAAVDR